MIPQITLSTAATGGIWTLVVVAVLTLIRSWPSLRKMGLDADTSLRTDLLTRINQLETQVAAMETAQVEERARHDAEIQLLRHRLNNETASLDALLLLLKVDPQKVMESVDMITEMRARKAQEIALEKGAMASKHRGMTE